jgi:hypothetical protein
VSEIEIFAFKALPRDGALWGKGQSDDLSSDAADACLSLC